jgi:hypothetical protein
MNTRYQNSSNPRPLFGVGLSCLLFLVIAVAIYYGTPGFWGSAKSVLGFPTSTLYIAGCHRWEEINNSMVGKSECVYGIVVSMVNDADPSPTVINFSNQSGKFYLIDNEMYYPDLTIGSCVQVEEYISLDEYQTLHMDITNLYECENNQPRQQTELENPTLPIPAPTKSILYHPVTWMELDSFLQVDPTNLRSKNRYDPDYYNCLDFSVDLVENANKQNIKGWIVAVEFDDGGPGHAFVAFETTDLGIVYIEPQLDIRFMNPVVGAPFCDAWEGTMCSGSITSIEFLQCDHSHNCNPFMP